MDADLPIRDQDSAGPLLPDVVYFGIEATHSNMCKFESKNSPGYLNVSTTIKTWVQECLPTIQARWDMERRTRRQIREAQAAELLDIYVSLNYQRVSDAATLVALIAYLPELPLITLLT